MKMEEIIIDDGYYIWVAEGKKLSQALKEGGWDYLGNGVVREPDVAHFPYATVQDKVPMLREGDEILRDYGELPLFTPVLAGDGDCDTPKDWKCMDAGGRPVNVFEDFGG